LAVLLPTILTIWICVWIYKVIQDNISVYVSKGLIRLIMFVQREPGFSKEQLSDILVEGAAGSVIGFLVALVIVCVVGAMLANVVGKAELSRPRLLLRSLTGCGFRQEVLHYPGLNVCFPGCPPGHRLSVTAEAWYP